MLGVLCPERQKTRKENQMRTDNRMDQETVLAENKINTADDLRDFLSALNFDYAMYIYLPGSSETVAGIQVVELTLSDGSRVRNLRLLR